MKLKKIEIFGFKSFADKQTLEFNEGITAIVGPNGCGKSNIADAFRWVLGEQSAKSMRGGKMHDVIFAGTTKRAPLNVAEVTITLSEVQDVLEIDYDEVAITRRLYRSGESQYLINKHPVRLKDVQDLLLGSGIGKNAFSIFEQGKIDQIIHYTPIERRGIFEEAAGILRFLQRKRDAIRKLEGVDSNLDRIRDIHQEVEKQIVVLEKQAEKARVYKDKKTLLEQLEKALFVAKWDHNQKRRSEFVAKQETQQEKLNSNTNQLQASENKLREERQTLVVSEKNFRAKSEEIFKTRSEKEIKAQERQSHHERLKELALKKKRWQEELANLAERRSLRHLEADSMHKQQQKTEKILADEEQELEKMRNAVHTLENSVSESRDQQQTHQQEVMKLTQTENQIESEAKQNALRQENLIDRRAQLDERQEKLSALIKEASHNATEKKKELQKAVKSVDDQKEQFADLESRLEEIQDEIKQAQQFLDSSIHEIAESKARQKALIRLRDDMEGFSTGSKRLLKESNDANSPLFQKVRGLYEYISSTNGVESALAAILKPYAQTLVLETAADFNLVTEFAAKNKLKDFSILCLETLPTSTHKPKKIENTEALLQSVVDDILAVHFLKDVYVAETTAHAHKIFKSSPATAVWTREGTYLDSNGVLFYTSPGENNVFMREAELKKLEQHLEALEKRRTDADNIVKQRQLQRNELMTMRTALDKNIRRDEMTLVEINFSMQRLTSELEKAQNEDKQIANEIKGINLNLETLITVLEGLKQKQTAIKAKIAHQHETYQLLNQNLEKQLATLKTDKANLQERELIHRKAVDEHKKLVHSLHILEVKDTESKQQEQRLAEEIETSGDLEEYIIKKEAEVKQTLADVEKTLEANTAVCLALEQEVLNKKNHLEQIEQEIANERKLSKPIEDDLQKLGIQIAQLETASTSLVQELQERYSLAIEDARQEGHAIEKSIEQTERQVRGLRQEIGQSGDINMTAIEEYDQHKIRHSFLNQQITDMDGSKKELMDIISQLDSESRKMFKDTFEIIRVNFRKNFEILFNGGEADLQFAESEDILEAGVEIIAKPPGKQMRSIQLLSGGEKCMTAVALLFAIFEVKPAPFCILDEIDAPLDESNVVRFATVVQQFIDRCQFIIITHNKRTMTVADVMFGVSMEERGVSKLLSMSFAKAEAARETLVSIN